VRGGPLACGTCQPAMCRVMRGPKDETGRHVGHVPHVLLCVCVCTVQGARRVLAWEFRQACSVYVRVCSYFTYALMMCASVQPESWSRLETQTA